MNFDEKAKLWDSDPSKIERAEIAAEAIRSLISDNPSSKASINKALEFGAGTGRLSLCLSDKIFQITLCDTSAGMLEIAKQNITDQNAENIDVKLLIPDSYNYPSQFSGKKFDLIYSMLAVHHIVDLIQFFSNISQLQDPGGLIAIIDLEKEDGSFHDNNPEFDGHSGFERSHLSQILFSNHYSEIEYKVIHIIEKNNTQYPIFMQAFRKI